MGVAKTLEVTSPKTNEKGHLTILSGDLFRLFSSDKTESLVLLDLCYGGSVRKSV